MSTRTIDPSPAPSSPAIFFGLFVISRTDVTPRSRRIAAAGS